MTQKASDPDKRSVFRPPADQESIVSLIVDESSSGIRGEADIIEVSASDTDADMSYLVNFNKEKSLTWANVNPHSKMENPDVPQYSAASIWKEKGSYRRPESDEPARRTVERASKEDSRSADKKRGQRDLARSLVIDEVNKRVVAPLLLGTGLLLLIAALGALVNGSVLLAAVFLPAPAATFWLLWKARNKWQ